MDEARQIHEFLDYVRNNRFSVDSTINADPIYIRRFAAENGIELTPHECASLIRILQTGSEMVGDN